MDKLSDIYHKPEDTQQYPNLKSHHPKKRHQIPSLLQGTLYLYHSYQPKPPTCLPSGIKQNPSSERIFHNINK